MALSSSHLPAITASVLPIQFPEMKLSTDVTGILVQKDSLTQKYFHKIGYEHFAVDLVVCHAGRVFYKVNKEIWSFIPTDPFALSVQICKTEGNIAELVVRDEKVCYQLEGASQYVECELKPYDPSATLYIILQCNRDLYKCMSVYPVSLSACHFACVDESQKQRKLFLIEITEKNRLKILSCEFPYLGRVSEIAMLSHEEQTFVILSSEVASVWKFSDDKILQIDNIRFEEKMGFSDIKKSISLPDSRTVLFTSTPERAGDFDHFTAFKFDSVVRRFELVRIQHQSIHSVISCSPYFIAINLNNCSIGVQRQNNYEKEGSSLEKPDFTLYFPNANNIVAWPYDAEKGQLWAIAHDKKNGLYTLSKLMLVKFKEGEPLQKIKDIEADCTVDHRTLSIANNILFYVRTVGKYTHRIAYNPETGLEKVMQDDHNILMGRKWSAPKSFGTPFGLLTLHDHILDLASYPPKVMKASVEIAESIPTFPRGLVSMVSGYLNHNIFHQSWSLPPAESKSMLEIKPPAEDKNSQNLRTGR